ncbi:MAG: tRNA (guanosine(37)-N1)-methyltransferase TrmD [Bacteroidetes bacterium]|jgi:tRNA (guanine37-N1)-methyltransferase|nr:tRNA (guanosine(37)-N1)-methyltransferase TrmD [Bacteroidota bacterium]
MRIDVIAVIPELLEGPFSHSILQRAQKRGLLEVHVHDLRAFGLGKHQQIDDYAYGGEAGMVMKPEPVFACVEALQSQRAYDEIIFLTPDGQSYHQQLANRLSLHQNLILLCGHYKGLDERVRDHLITMEISIGDYVLSGGELAAAVVVDSIGRLIPGVLNDESSALTDSFQDHLLAPPVYTRPAEFRGWKVPEVLRSGNFPKIEQWREDQAYMRTKERRPDLLGD